MSDRDTSTVVLRVFLFRYFLLYYLRTRAILVALKSPLVYVISKLHSKPCCYYADLRREISKAKSEKSAGLDKISNKLLKAAEETIITSLQHIFNLSIDTGIFPDEMKHTKVTPIYKSGDKKDCGNYRPISLTSAVSKILEKLVCKQLNFFFTIQ